MLNVIDVGIFFLIIFGAIMGFRRGVIKQGVITVGTFLVLILSFILKNPISAFMYKVLPFFDFDIIIKNASVLNILVYETLAFIIAFSLLEIILIVLIRFSSIAETILRATVVLEVPSKILGILLGALQTYQIIFIVLFFISQPTFGLSKTDIVKNSKVTPIVLSHTPVLSNMTNKAIETFEEIDVLIENKNKYSSEEFNCKSLKILIKNRVLSKKSALYLYENKKINTKCGT